MEPIKQIVFTKINTAELLDVECAAVSENDVKVKTMVSSVSCGTEKANITGEKYVNFQVDYEIPFPRVSGYSSSGVVVEVGSKVTSVAVGDRVAMAGSLHRQINVLHENSVVKIEDDNISFEEAALCNIATFPLAAVRKTHLEMGESAMVMGLGVLGLFAVVFARAAGAVPVIAVDPIAERREKALQYGADYAFDPFEPDFVEKVKSVTKGGVNAAIEVTGVGAGLNQCLDCMARFGRIALLGCTRDQNFTVDYYKKVHGPGIQIIGAHTNARPMKESYPGYFTTRDDISTILKLCGGGRINVKEMLEEIYAPQDCHEVYTRLINDRNFPAVAQFDWRKLQ